jgi:hypothetical protein
MSNVSPCIAGRQDRVRADRAVRQMVPRIRSIADETVKINAKPLVRAALEDSALGVAPKQAEGLQRRTMRWRK